MKIFAVRLNADPRPGKPYSAYPTQKEYQEICEKSVGNGFHEAVNFLAERGKVKGYLPPKPAKALQEADLFTLVSMTYKGDRNNPNKVLGVQFNCKFVGETTRDEWSDLNLTWHYVCDSKDSFIFTRGIDDAFQKLISDNPRDWYRGGPTKEIDQNKFLYFIDNITERDVGRSGFEKLKKFRQYYESDISSLNQSFDQEVERALKADLTNVTGNITPKKREIKIWQFVRDPKVVAFALKRANGKYESCKNDAPFSNKVNGRPFLEVHHKVTLANGGEDTPNNAIAICPNCHRQFHYG